MPDESCRRCGWELESLSLCSQCETPIQKICTLCGTKTDEQFHSKCFYGIELFQEEALMNRRY